MLLFQPALLYRLPKCSFTRFTSALQFRSLGIDVRAPVTYRPVRTNVLDHPQPSGKYAKLLSDQDLRKLDGDHEQRVDAGL